MDKHDVKQKQLEYIHKYKSAVNMKRICENAGVNYKQFIAGINSDHSRVSTRLLEKYIKELDIALTIEKKQKLFMVYKYYFDIQMSRNCNTSVSIKTNEQDALLKLQYFVDKYKSYMNSNELTFIEKEIEEIKTGGKRDEQIIKQA